MYISSIIEQLPPELIYKIDKLIHLEYQMPVNKEIIRVVEKLEDAIEIEDLNYYHIHCITKSTIPLYLMPDAFKRTSYKWIYETVDDCFEYDNLGNITNVCNKEFIYRKSKEFYDANGIRYISEPRYNNSYICKRA